MSKIKYSLQDGNGDGEQASRAKRERREEEKKSSSKFFFFWKHLVQKERILENFMITVTVSKPQVLLVRV